MIRTSIIAGESNAIKCELAAEVLRSSGRLRLKVTGWSMLPSVFPGDLLLVEQSDTNEPGDIVLFHRDRRLVAHRMIHRSEKAGVTTRGDAMAYPDPPVRREEMLGKVVLISRNGKDIKPRKRMRLTERAVAACVRHSDIAARLVVRVHGLRQKSPA
jgi:SOS-response transcriptional repressor LexA